LSDNWSYDVALHSGLKTSAANSFKPRNGRQKVSEADASNFAGTLRLRWTPMPNLQTSIVGQYQDDISQDSGDGAGSALLINLNAEYTLDKFSIRALYATWNIQGSAVEAVDADSQVGYYVEPAYRISEQWGVFARYGIYDNTVDANDTEKRQMDFGVNYWLNPNVVFKADYQIQDNENDENQDGFNLGVGYSF
jgi:predicted porin